VFFGTLEKPLTARESRQAKTICGACPVLRDCLINALRKGEKYGVWAGLTSIERRRLLRDNGSNVIAAIAAWDSQRMMSA
jgi:WhiB family redox-sensing transcriptional regulator